MLTIFGKEIRKLRIDREETLAQMAINLKKSSTFLTAIETGRKPVPDDYIEAVGKYFDLGMEKIAELRQAADLSRPAVKITMPVGTPADGREFAVRLAKSFDTLNRNDFARLNEILDQKEAGAK